MATTMKRGTLEDTIEFYSQHAVTLDDFYVIALNDADGEDPDDFLTRVPKPFRAGFEAVVFAYPNERTPAVTPRIPRAKPEVVAALRAAIERHRARGEPEDPPKGPEDDPMVMLRVLGKFLGGKDIRIRAIRHKDYPDGTRRWWVTYTVKMDEGEDFGPFDMFLMENPPGSGRLTETLAPLPPEYSAPNPKPTDRADRNGLDD